MHMHRYEKYWLVFGILTLVVFLTVLGINAFAQGHQPHGHTSTSIDPTKVNETPPFDEPGISQIDDQTYEANIIAMAFGYSPNKIEVPVGSKVLFRLTSSDVIHSFTIPKTNVNAMIVPGHITEMEHTFTEPGEYLVVCNEYCGTGHHNMQMRIEVTE
ncbi:cytochrome c oxidase subunit II [Desertibacillus haloalkaliphilus]|uniref:cytochrome c oxidase subunit II n=1 Tax=Desertibacillus haloalkaliphilus TaxID=1328930 RepID=UPI001C26A094|nr:cytochrome c oxidase subunit II [Desertibacillus haloalkaliphilus]MBU8908785.1 cytochrome c oxidase subunit II [Desertibacillus haloalkaliphilus]